MFPSFRPSCSMCFAYLFSSVKIQFCESPDFSFVVGRSAMDSASLPPAVHTTFSACFHVLCFVCALSLVHGASRRTIARRWQIYELVTKHFLACCSKDAVGHQTKASPPPSAPPTLSVLFFTKCAALGLTACWGNAP